MVRSLVVLPTVLAMYLPFCAVQHVRPTTHPSGLPVASLWTAPTDLADRDLFYGPWGPERAPDPAAVYSLVETKHTGVNPGMTVRDPEGREWNVKQAARDERPDEGPVEVAVSRVLSAVGYHQPPVYYLPSFTLKDDWGRHLEPGGRFRLKVTSLKDRGSWSFQQNPFVGTDPFEGLLVILMMFNASDLKNSNNTLYEFSSGRHENWYVVRDLGTALGTTGRFVPEKNNVDAFERHGFLKGVRNGFVEFAYAGFHQEMVRDRITPGHVQWASDLLGSLEEHQWQEAFMAGGYKSAVATRFIRVLQQKIATGKTLAISLPGEQR